MQNFDQSLDARGLNCPLPILKMGKALRAMESGQVIQMLATDPGSQKDVDSFCSQAGHSLLASERAGDEFVYLIRKN